MRIHLVGKDSQGPIWTQFALYLNTVHFQPLRNVHRWETDIVSTHTMETCSPVIKRTARRNLVTTSCTKTLTLCTKKNIDLSKSGMLLSYRTIYFLLCMNCHLVCTAWGWTKSTVKVWFVNTLDFSCEPVWKIPLKCRRYLFNQNHVTAFYSLFFCCSQFVKTVGKTVFDRWLRMFLIRLYSHMLITAEDGSTGAAVIRAA